MEQYTYMVEGHGSQERAGANPALGTLGRLAQWLECLVYTEKVAGSSPAPPTKNFKPW